MCLFCREKKGHRRKNSFLSFAVFIIFINFVTVDTR